LQKVVSISSLPTTGGVIGIRITSCAGVCPSLAGELSQTQSPQPRHLTQVPKAHPQAQPRPSVCRGLIFSRCPLSRRLPMRKGASWVDVRSIAWSCRGASLASNTPAGGWRAAWRRLKASLARARESGRC